MPDAGSNVSRLRERLEIFGIGVGIFLGIAGAGWGIFSLLRNDIEKLADKTAVLEREQERTLRMAFELRQKIQRFEQYHLEEFYKDCRRRKGRPSPDLKACIYSDGTVDKFEFLEFNPVDWRLPAGEVLPRNDEGP